jgi:hypothetical protein
MSNFWGALHSGQWRTATIDIARTRPLSVRLLGGGAGDVPKTRTTPAKMGKNEGNVPKTGTLPAVITGAKPSISRKVR